MRLYNTLTRQKEEFRPREEGKVGMYVCGPTTYNFIHLGNARPLIVFDTVRRYLEFSGYEVKFIQNFTDIDDKIINRSQQENLDPISLAARYIEEFFSDSRALGVREATVHPKVSEHMPEIVDMIQALIDKGFAYVVDGDVYYSVKAFKGYGKLSGRSLEDMQAGARVAVDERKQQPMDFALWKSAKPGEPSWNSPWGPGRPGWHIECSVMSLKYLGESFDIHGGGFDLIFPHHENEIAQSEAYAGGKPFARYWMHNGFITVNEEKMSKSLGNFFTVREILAKFSAQVVRLFMLSTHYRSPLDFHDGKLEEMQKSLERLKNTVESSNSLLKGWLGPFPTDKDQTALATACQDAERKFREAMDDDFNTALAIGVLFELARDINSFVAGLGGQAGDQAELEAVYQGRATLLRLARVLGLLETQQAAEAQDSGLTEGLMEIMLAIRKDARDKKDWPTADKIRDELGKLGVVIEDTPQGARWKKR
ncbi:MAG TPA: cysteine--tRNA ligase [Bacillota bacterium]|nr:cysteine--tRNA ligase [Bacillota bacterium]